MSRYPDMRDARFVCILRRLSYDLAFCLVRSDFKQG